VYGSGVFERVWTATQPVSPDPSTAKKNERNPGLLLQAATATRSHARARRLILDPFFAGQTFFADWSSRLGLYPSKSVGMA
jgi:hypothetical protein